jgi:hypothetical protein
MDARIEFLERAYEGYMAIQKENQELRQLLEAEKFESQKD